MFWACAALLQPSPGAVQPPSSAQAAMAGSRPAAEDALQASKIYLSVIPVVVIGTIIGFIGARYSGHRRQLHPWCR
jgi:hypothetical protein